MSLPQLPKFPEGFKFRSLEEATEVKETAEKGVYDAYLREDWCIGVVPHGGYLTSLLLRAARTYFLKYHPTQPDGIHISQTFSTRCSIGPGRITVTPVKIGRQYSFVRVELFQSSHLCLTATVTHSSLSAEASAGGLNGPRSPHTFLPPLAECVAAPAPDPAADFRVAEKKLDYRYPRGTIFGSIPGTLLRQQWVKFADGRKLTPVDLGMVADMFIPLPINLVIGKDGDGAMRVRSWYPTLWLSLEVKRPGPWEWVGVKVEARRLVNGRFDIDVVMVDEQGEVVAVSNHCAIVVGIERNSKKVKGDQSKL